LICENLKIKEKLNISGDEAMLLAKSLPNATIIVSENREKAIIKAKELKCKIVYLDDGYRHHNIEKFDILLRPKEDPKNLFCLPSGGYRDTPMMYSFSNLTLRETKEFKRVVTYEKNNKTIETLPEKLVLITAISKPNRLLEFLPKSINIITYPDHYNFQLEDIENLKLQYPNQSIITTEKDMVKLEKFNLENLYLMKLQIIIDEESIKKINSYNKV